MVIIELIFKQAQEQNRSYLSIEKGYDINIATPVSSGNIRTIGLRSDQIRLDAPAVYTKDLIVDGTTNGVSGLNIGAKTPIVFTTNRNVNINGSTFSVYDIDITKYVKYIILDGYNIRQFRMRTWYADADFQSFNMHCTRNDIFMSNRGGLNICAICMPFENQFK
jgi:hypothetical protein